MITGFEEETEPLTDDEKKLVKLFVHALKKRTSKNPVTSQQMIAGFKTWSIRIAPSRIRKIINHIRLHGLVQNLVATSRGYYVETDPKEIERYVKSLRQRASAILKVAASFKPK